MPKLISKSSGFFIRSPFILILRKIERFYLRQKSSSDQSDKFRLLPVFRFEFSAYSILRRKTNLVQFSISILETILFPVSAQNTSKSLCAASSVTKITNSSPAFKVFNILRARRTGRGHFKSLASNSSINCVDTLKDGWGAWIRTRDHGIKTRCLTAWLRPILSF